VLFNSHLLAEVEQMCDRIAILQGGELVFEGPIKGLEDEHQMYEIECDTPERLAALTATHGGEVESGMLILPSSIDPALVLRDLVQAGMLIRSFTPKHRSLEDLYMEIKQQGPISARA
jgi:ABC-2 type transport system ATP-binding protein